MLSFSCHTRHDTWVEDLRLGIKLMLSCFFAAFVRVFNDFTALERIRKKLKEIMEEARSPCGMLVVKMSLGKAMIG